MSYFITGTDTSVGKTLVSCALLHIFAMQNLRVVGMKPVSCGCDDKDRIADVMLLRRESNVLASYGQINPYSFYPPVAPHIAARNSGITIDFSRILTSFRELASQAEVVIVEGIGGFKVPLGDHQDSVVLTQLLELPVILVVGMRLGCLNHALLTTDAIMASGLKLAGWVANVLDAEMPVLQENISALKQRLPAPLLGVIEFLPEACAGQAASYLDVALLRNR